MVGPWAGWIASNVTSSRPSRDRVPARQSEAGGKVWVLELGCRFGDVGIVAVVCTRSCRAHTGVSCQRRRIWMKKRGLIISLDKLHR
jgi:hypothetical protein